MFHADHRCPGLGSPTDETPKLNAGLVGSLGFRNIGPAFMSGRIVDIAVDPTNRSVWYVAAGSGGVWKDQQCRHHLVPYLR